MNRKRICWGVTQNDAGRLAAFLRPVRTREEVGRILGCSPDLIMQIEASALRKIISAMTEFEKTQTELTNNE
jgi:DNA-directed RNA polymerase sigma subunit (sigma70/sigma32)